MTLHIETLAIAAFAVSFALTLALTAMAAFLKAQPGLRRWVQALWLVAAATVLFGLRGKVPDAIPVLLANGLLALSAALIWMGVRDFCGLPRDLRPVVVVTAVVLGFQALFLWGWPQIEARHINMVLMSATWSLATAWTLHRRGPAGLAASSRLVAALFLADAGLNLGLVAPNLVALWNRDAGLLHATQAATYLVGLVVGTFEVLGLAILLNHRLMEELQRLARTDGLTGVLTRRALEAEAARLLEVCRRQAIPCSVLMVDLDHFKRLNDTHGHGGGDEALRHFASLARTGLRATDLFSRYGGEEFCILMPGAHGAEALSAAERLRELVAHHPVPWQDHPIPLTVSIGLASYEPGAGAAPPDHGALVEAADRALYRAKALGRNRVEAAAT
jgi:diguanylate cyclase (GGDEF)-like protein